MQHTIERPAAAHVLGHTGIGVDQEIATFIHRLRHCGFSSIDQFLAFNDECAAWGKRFIAAGLMPHEREAIRNGSFCGDWHAWMFQRLATAGKLDVANVHFVSFNYDRLFELSMALMATNAFGNPFRPLLSDLRQTTITHVYGTFQCEEANRLTNLLAVGQSLRNERPSLSVSAGANGLSVIPAQRGSVEPIPSIASRALSADRIIFLGFSFDKLNLMRIGMHKTNAAWMNRPTPEIFASGYGLHVAERTAAGSELGHPVNFGTITSGCLETLRTLVTW